MCGICGCSSDNGLSTKESSKQSISELANAHIEAHHSQAADARVVQVEQELLSRNNHIALHNREDFSQRNVATLNLVSSPGSGKTSLLEHTLKALSKEIPCVVIEGDQQTSNDADRIAATGVPVRQINTGVGCHLEAKMIRDVVPDLPIQSDSLLFVENVGNLVCPAMFDLGEYAKVVILSVTEGADKPLKYPHMFKASRLMLVNKIDLLPYVDFDVQQCIEYARQINPDIEVIEVSATQGQGMQEWFSWLKNAMRAVQEISIDAHHHKHDEPA